MARSSLPSLLSIGYGGIDETPNFTLDESNRLYIKDCLVTPGLGLRYMCMCVYKRTYTWQLHMSETAFVSSSGGPANKRIHMQLQPSLLCSVLVSCQLDRPRPLSKNPNPTSTPPERALSKWKQPHYKVEGVGRRSIVRASKEGFSGECRRGALCDPARSFFATESHVWSFTSAGDSSTCVYCWLIHNILTELSI